MTESTLINIFATAGLLCKNIGWRRPSMDIDSVTSANTIEMVSRSGIHLTYTVQNCLSSKTIYLK